MVNVLEGMLANRAQKILRYELAFMIISLVFTLIFLAASIYFETTFAIGSYAFLLGTSAFLSSYAFFYLIFRVFKDNIRYRAMKGDAGLSGRAMIMANSFFIAIMSLFMYIVCFGLFGVAMPWHGDGREYLYVSYFFLCEAALFLGRGLAYYYSLKRHMISSLESYKR
jgi:hypothetical protein